MVTTVLRQNPIRDSVCALLPAFKFLDAARERPSDSFAQSIRALGR